MRKPLPLLATGLVAGLAILLARLSAADAPAPAAASGSGSAAPVPAAASSAERPTGGRTPPKPDLAKLPKASDKKDLTFAKDIAPMFKASCNGCHVGSARPSGGLDLGTLAAALKGGRENKDKDIVPGHGDQSFALLYAADAVKGAEMPPLSRRNAQHPALTKDQLADLRAWIDAGAK